MGAPTRRMGERIRTLARVAGELREDAADYRKKANDAEDPRQRDLLEAIAGAIDRLADDYAERAGQNTKPRRDT